MTIHTRCLCCDYAIICVLNHHTLLWFHAYLFCRFQIHIRRRFPMFTFRTADQRLKTFFNPQCLHIMNNIIHRRTGCHSHFYIRIVQFTDQFQHAVHRLQTTYLNLLISVGNHFIHTLLRCLRQMITRLQHRTIMK